MKGTDIQVISRFGKVEWLLLGGILITAVFAGLCLALFVQSL